MQACPLGLLPAGIKFRRIYNMGAVFGELATYLIKFAVMLVCAGLGICVGKVLRKRKNEKIAAENADE